MLRKREGKKYACHVWFQIVKCVIEFFFFLLQASCLGYLTSHYVVRHAGLKLDQEEEVSRLDLNTNKQKQNAFTSASAIKS